MDTRAQSISLWITPFFGVILLLCFTAFPGFWPPIPPDMTAEQVAAFYDENRAMVRFSMITFNLCAIMLVPFFMVVVVQIKRTASHVLAYSYLAAIATGATLFAIADIFWLVAAFRPERDPELVLLLNDLAWMIFVAPVGMLVVQNLCLALAILLDDRAKPVFPRWVAYFSIATAVAMTPAVCAVAVTSGPLAWDGAISFWLRFSAFGLNIVVLFVVLLGVVRRQRDEQTATEASSSSAQPEPVS